MSKTVKIDDFTFGLLKQLQKHFKDNDKLKVTKTNLIRNAVQEYHRLKMPR